MLYLGFAAFALFFLGDWNDWRLKRNWLRPCFFVGVALLVVSTVGLCIGRGSALPVLFRVIFGILALIFGALTLYAVLSVAFKTGKSTEKKVCTDGLYALCRHPGVLFFVPLYFCLWLSCGLPIYAAAIFCLLNGLLIVFEDVLVFPALLDDYDRYKLQVPFIIPSISSLKRLLRKKSKDGLS